MLPQKIKLGIPEELQITVLAMKINGIINHLTKPPKELAPSGQSACACSASLKLETLSSYIIGIARDYKDDDTLKFQGQNYIPYSIINNIVSILEE